MRRPECAGSKADFNQIYDRPDPRSYYTTLGSLDYRIPETARPVVEAVHGDGGSVVDLCCSYGVNAAQLRFGSGFAELADRYGRAPVSGMSPEDVLAADREHFAQHPRRPDLRVVGLDVSEPAIRYAVAAGLLADGWAEDLESNEPSSELVAGLADVTTVVCTGGVGYIGAPTFRRVLDALPDPAGVRAAVFVLRVFDYAPIAAEFANHGLVTERLPGVTFAQRRFADAAEQDAALRDVAERGLDPSGKEADGWFHAECWVSRPAADAARTPVEELLL